MKWANYFQQPSDLDKFKASRPTVAKAVQKLVDENILGRKAGLELFLKINLIMLAQAIKLLLVY